MNPALLEAMGLASKSEGLELTVDAAYLAPGLESYMLKAPALDGLSRARDALYAIGVRPFLVDGTLLGAVREGDFIAHDNDTDMGVFADQYNPSIMSAMRRAGFRHRRTYGTSGCGLELVFKRRRVKLDLFFYYRDGNTLWHAAYKHGEMIRYDYPAFELAPLIFLGETFLAPADPLKFITTKYGPEWRTPIKDWDWAWGPRNARSP